MAKERPPVPNFTGCGRLCMPCSTYARQIGAVPSGRSVNDRPPMSSNVNISFWTMSVDSPTPRANSSVSSKIGVSTYPYAARRGGVGGIGNERPARRRVLRQHVEGALRRLEAQRASSARNGLLARSAPSVVTPM